MLFNWRFDLKQNLVACSLNYDTLTIWFVGIAAKYEVAIFIIRIVWVYGGAFGISLSCPFGTLSLSD